MWGSVYKRIKKYRRYNQYVEYALNHLCIKFGISNVFIVLFSPIVTSLFVYLFSMNSGPALAGQIDLKDFLINKNYKYARTFINGSIVQYKYNEQNIIILSDGAYKYKYDLGQYDVVDSAAHDKKYYIVIFKIFDGTEEYFRGLYKLLTCNSAGVCDVTHTFDAGARSITSSNDGIYVLEFDFSNIYYNTESYFVVPPNTKVSYYSFAKNIWVEYIERKSISSIYYSEKHGLLGYMPFTDDKRNPIPGIQVLSNGERLGGVRPYVEIQGRYQPSFREFIFNDLNNDVICINRYYHLAKSAIRYELYVVKEDGTFHSIDTMSIPHVVNGKIAGINLD